MLFFVDDHQSEIAEFDALGQQRMGADDDIDIAGRQTRLGFARLLRIDETRELAKLHRKALEPFAKGTEMLAREKRGGDDDRDLLARHRHDEGGSQRHFRLAEADIAADEPIHRPPLGEILDCIRDRFFLVFGLLIGKARAEFVVEPLRRLDLRQRFQLARGGDAHQFRRDLAHARLHARLAALPARAAQTVELGRAFVGAVARQKFDVLHRQEQFSAVILQFETIMRRFRHIDRAQADIAPDTVLDMGDEIVRARDWRLRRENSAHASTWRAAAPCGRRECPARR